MCGVLYSEEKETGLPYYRGLKNLQKTSVIAGGRSGVIGFEDVYFLKQGAVLFGYPKLRWKGEHFELFKVIEKDGDSWQIRLLPNGRKLAQQFMSNLGQLVESVFKETLHDLRYQALSDKTENAAELYTRLSPWGDVEQVDGWKRFRLFDLGNANSVEAYLRIGASRLIEIIQQESVYFHNWLDGKSHPIYPDEYEKKYGDLLKGVQLRGISSDRDFEDAMRVNSARARGVRKDNVYQTKNGVIDIREPLIMTGHFQAILGIDYEPTFADIGKLCLRLPSNIREGRLRDKVDAAKRYGLLTSEDRGKRTFYKVGIPKVIDSSGNVLFMQPHPTTHLSIFCNVAREQNLKLYWIVKDALDKWKNWLQTDV